eukprot:917383_1
MAIQSENASATTAIRHTTPTDTSVDTLTAASLIRKLSLEESQRMFELFAAKLFHQEVLKAYLELVAEQKDQNFCSLSGVHTDRMVVSWRSDERNTCRHQGLGDLCFYMWMF